jgi:hypothetical protein
MPARDADASAQREQADRATPSTLERAGVKGLE